MHDKDITLFYSTRKLKRQFTIRVLSFRDLTDIVIILRLEPVSTEPNFDINDESNVKCFLYPFVLSQAKYLPRNAFVFILIVFV